MTLNGRELASINGVITDLKDGRVSVLDHGFLYGDGIFEGIRFINNKILFHKEHLARLYTSAEVFRIPMIHPHEFEQLLFRVVKESCLISGYIRVVVSRGIGGLDINPKRCTNSNLVIIVSKLQLYPEEFYEKGLKVIVARTNKI